MRLTPGAKIAHYEIVSSLGAGGMGEVYRARDTKLRRDVAIKVLPASVADDSERLQRIQNEAHALAALNHPHIAAIYGLEDVGEIRALVLELVEGETLTERLANGPLPVPEVLAIAGQLIDALDAAHDSGVIHRDLKPDNIKLTRDGTVKVLDFGIAKVRESALAGGMPPLTTVHRTQVGTILGTPPYMSPEQARGELSDKRTDIWALGCVLYEMLTGRQAFSGKTDIDTLGTVIGLEPDWETLPRETPPGLRRLLVRCLTKNRKHRLRDLGDASAELNSTDSASGERRQQRPALVLAAGGFVGALVSAAALAFVWQSPEAAAPPSTHVARMTAQLEAPVWLGLDRPTLAWSPDGNELVYLERTEAGTRLYARALEQFEARAIEGTETAENPFLSLDGSRVGFFAGGKLKTVALRGGATTSLLEMPLPLGASWTRAGTIVVGSIGETALRMLPAGAAELQPIGPSSTGAAELVEAWPQALPDGQSVLYTAMPANGQPAYVAVVSLVSGERKMLTEGSEAQYVAPGYLVYMLGNDVMSLAFDLDRLEVSGMPIEVLENVQRDFDGAAQLAVSQSGNLAYVTAVAEAPRRLVAVDFRGQAREIALPARAYANPRVSPNGETIVVDIQSQNGRDIWTYDLNRSVWNQLTFDGASSVPIWTPDGQRITYMSSSDGSPKLYWRRADGSGSAELLSETIGNPHSWSPNGQFLLRTASAGAPIQVFALDERTMRPLTPKPEGTEMAAPAFAPDGRWIAYVANDSGRREVYVRPFPEGDGRWLVSDGGGTQPLWSHDGRQLFYRNDDNVMAVEVAPEPVFRATAPQLLFRGDYERPAVRASYDVLADGAHFVMLESSAQGSSTRRVNIVVNWQEELKRRVPAVER